MVIIQYVRSLVRTDTGTEFLYANGYEWDRNGVGDEQQDHRIPSGEPSGQNGEYQSDSFLSPRSWSYKLAGVQGADYADLQAKLDALWLAHPVGPLCHLRRQVISVTSGVSTVISDRFIECRIASRSKGPEMTMYRNQPTIAVRSGRPYYQDSAIGAPIALATNGTTAVTPGGTERCAPVFNLTVTHAGVVTLLESFYGKQISFNVVPGAYVIDATQPNNPIFLGGVPTLSAFVSGGAFRLTPLTSNITVTPSGGAALSAASVRFRRCWTFS